VKPGLDPRQNFRITIEDGQDLRVRLFEHTDSFGETFRPVCQTGAMVRSAQEYYSPSAVENLLQMSFRSLLCCRERLSLLEQHLGGSMADH
jgi:hypothetical protein